MHPPKWEIKTTDAGINLKEVFMQLRKFLKGISVLIVMVSLVACGSGGGGGGGGNGGTVGSGGGAASVQMGGALQGKPLSLTAAVTTLAGIASSTDGTGSAARFNNPNGVATDGTNLYVADTGSNTIRKMVISTGAVTTLAGAAGVIGSADGTGSAASFSSPTSITTDGTNLYVTDTGNGSIRKIVISTGAVTTLADSSAGFNSPAGITTDGTSLYVTDTYGNMVFRVVIASGAVSTLAGSGAPGSDDGTGTAASFNSPEGITTDGTSLYVADTGNGAIRQIDIASVNVSTPAAFTSPDGIATDGTNLYVTDTANNTVSKIVISSGVAATLAGASGIAGSADGTGVAARFSGPGGIVMVGTDLYVADSRNNTIRKIVASTGVVSTPAGAPASADGTGTAAGFNLPYDVTTDGTNLYVADSNNNTIRKVVISSGAVTTLAGTAGVGGAADGTGVAAGFNLPTGITTDGTNLYVADNGNGAIRKIVIATGAVTTVKSGLSSPAAITTDGTNLYVTDIVDNTISKIVISSGVISTLTGAGAGLSSPYGITTDGTSLYVADAGNNMIRKVAISTGAVTTLVGSVTAGIADGTGAAAGFSFPTGITTDGTNLYLSDSGNNTIRKVVISTGAVTTLAGTAGATGSTDAGGATAKFNNPGGITTDGTSLYVADTDNNIIRKIR
jgi:sugar lactone lactonase YvrE